MVDSVADGSIRPDTAQFSHTLDSEGIHVAVDLSHEQHFDIWQVRATRQFARLRSYVGRDKMFR